MEELKVDSSHVPVAKAAPGNDDDMERDPLLLTAQLAEDQPSSIATAHGIPHGIPVAPVALAAAQPPAAGARIFATKLGRFPQRLRCRHCHVEVITYIRYTTGCATILSCLGCLAIGCGAGCCLIPFCVDGLKDVVHHCPNCHGKVGTCGIVG